MAQSQALAAMHARLLAVAHRFGSGDADRIAFDLDLEIRFADPRHLGDDDEIVAFAEHVERRIGAAAARARAEPAAGAETVERALKLEERVERVG